MDPIKHCPKKQHNDLKGSLSPPVGNSDDLSIPQGSITESIVQKTEEGFMECTCETDSPEISRIAQGGSSDIPVEDADEVPEVRQEECKNEEEDSTTESSQHAFDDPDIDLAHNPDMTRFSHVLEPTESVTCMEGTAETSNEPSSKEKSEGTLSVEGLDEMQSLDSQHGSIGDMGHSESSTLGEEMAADLYETEEAGEELPTEKSPVAPVDENTDGHSSDAPPGHDDHASELSGQAMEEGDGVQTPDKEEASSTESSGAQVIPGDPTQPSTCELDGISSDHAITNGDDKNALEDNSTGESKPEVLRDSHEDVIRSCGNSLPDEDVNAEINKDEALREGTVGGCNSSPKDSAPHKEISTEAKTEESDVSRKSSPDKEKVTKLSSLICIISIYNEAWVLD